MRDAASLDQRDGDDNPVWTRLERDWMADAALAPGFEPSQVTAVRLRHTPSGDPMLGGAISFSNSITIEENTLGPGVVGHLLHARTISPVTFAAVDRWFAYHQVGSVLAETDADGELAATHHADAWGNRLEDWDTGVWGGVRVGWAHNTKEIDGLTDLTYMYQRWYAPETRTFLSRAPYPPMIEHEYGFGAENPVSFVDPDGRMVLWNPLTWGDDWVDGGHFMTGGSGAGAAFAQGGANGAVGFASGAAYNVSGGLLSFHDECNWEQSFGAMVGDITVDIIQSAKGAAKHGIKGVLGATKGKNKRKPNPNAEGPHTVFNERGYTTYDRNPRTSSGSQKVKNYDHVGEPHGGVDTPHVRIFTGEGKGTRKPNPGEGW